jgi:sec-independent protein translocase protein TatB
MFELGWAEIGIIGLVALLVLGPQEFLVVARSAGRFMGNLRRMAASWQAQVESALPADDDHDDTSKKTDGYNDRR